jgi:hypothetical protein
MLPVFLFVTALSFICALGVSAQDNAGGPPGGQMPEGMSGPPSGGGMPGGGGGMPEGGMPGGGGPGGGMTEGQMSGAMPMGGGMGGAPTEAAIYIEDGTENTEKEYDAGKYSAKIKSDAKGLTIKGLDMTSGDYEFNGIVASGKNSIVTIDGAKMKLGVTKESSASSGGAAVNISDDATVYINKSELVVDGAQRYVTNIGGDGILVINDSKVLETGRNEFTTSQTEPFSNPALLIYGIARTNMSTGSSHTYYFNSECITEGWAALSTDASSGDGLDLYAYNSKGIAQNGGYGTYADFGCRVWLYGSTLETPEIGAILSKSGQITVADGASAPADVLKYNTGKTTKAGSKIIAGRNAVMIHAPDMMGQGIGAADCGTFDVVNSTLATSKKLKSKRDYYTHINEAVGAYIDYTMGACLLVKSTSADITFDNATFDSFSNTAIMTVLNSDSMGNFLKDEGDGAKVKPIAITIKNMTSDGDIKHMDYQRLMTVSVENSTLNAAVVSGTMEDWNGLWTKYNKEDCNWLVDTTYNTRYGVQLTLKKGATWNVTGASSLSSLTLENGATLKGSVKVDGKTVKPAAAKTYTGNIVVMPL